MDPSHFSDNGSGCTGEGSFTRVRDGATVTVDGDATATLSAGEISQEGNCRFLFEVMLPEKDVPKRYQVQVAGMPPVTGLVNTDTPIYWQSPDADGWVTIGWD